MPLISERFHNRPVLGSIINQRPSQKTIYNISLFNKVPCSLECHNTHVLLCGCAGVPFSIPTVAQLVKQTIHVVSFRYCSLCYLAYYTLCWGKEQVALLFQNNLLSLSLFVVARRSCAQGWENLQLILMGSSLLFNTMGALVSFHLVWTARASAVSHPCTVYLLIISVAIWTVQKSLCFLTAFYNVAYLRRTLETGQTGLVGYVWEVYIFFQQMRIFLFYCFGPQSLHGVVVSPIHRFSVSLIVSILRI